MTTRLDHARDALFEALPAMLKPFGVDDAITSRDIEEATDRFIDETLDALCSLLEAHGIDPHVDPNGNRY